MSEHQQDRDLVTSERGVLGISVLIGEKERPRHFAVAAIVTACVTVGLLSGCKEEEKEAAKEAVREFIAEEEAKSDAKKDEVWGDLNKVQRKQVPNPFDNKEENSEGSQQ